VIQCDCLKPVVGVAKYKQCERGQIVVAPVTSLTAQAYCHPLPRYLMQSFQPFIPTPMPRHRRHTNQTPDSLCVCACCVYAVLML
jgi:hypothetical protein